MAASLQMLSLFTPQVRRSSATFQPSPSKLVFSHNTSSLNKTGPSRFIRNVAVSSQLVEEKKETIFSPEFKLFVGNLPFSADSAVLAALFQQAGTVEMVEVILDKSTGRSRGFGFVTMSTLEEAEAAAQQFNGYELKGRPLRVNYGPPPPTTRENLQFRGSRERIESDITNKVYVGNLAWEVDNNTLENLFNGQGHVRDARVVCERNGHKSRGFGFVTYSTPEEVNNAVKSLNGIDLNGRIIRVSHADDRAKEIKSWSSSYHELKPDLL